MSYARRGYGWLDPELASDVYVYAHTSGGWVCDDCPRLGHHSEPTPFTMAMHLVDDRMAGYTVPQEAIDLLVFDSENGSLQGCRFD
jgi:hypothetical protein